MNRAIRTENVIKLTNIMKKAFLLSFFVFIGISTTAAQSMVMVGGEAMSPQKDIVENAVNSADHTTLVAAVKTAGLVETLKGNGPFTVFAPTNDAFENLPDGTVETLLKPENKNKLTDILTYHVVPGNITYEAAAKAIEENGGKATLETVNGSSLTFMWNGQHNIVVQDEQGNVGHISTYNVMQSNGVIHVVDTVLMPAN